MGERVKSKDRKRRGEKDEILKGRHRIGQLLGPSYAGANESAIGTEGGYGRENHQLLLF
jgi:hypothetical protein